MKTEGCFGFCSKRETIRRQTSWTGKMRRIEGTDLARKLGSSNAGREGSSSAWTEDWKREDALAEDGLDEGEVSRWLRVGSYKGGRKRPRCPDGLAE
jgi:hypothetical protein